MYVCMYALGSSAALAQVNCGQPHNLRATSVAVTKAVIQWQVSGPRDSFALQYRKTGAPVWRSAGQALTQTRFTLEELG
jgi:hypothetical protein